MKSCLLCGLTKSLDAFGKKRDTYDGLTSRCRDCQGAVSRERYAKRKDVILERNRGWYAENKDWYQPLRAKRRDVQADRLRSKRYYEANKDKCREIQTRWDQKNPEKLRASWKKYAATHPEVKSAQAVRRRFRRRQAYAQWDQELTEFVTQEALALCRAREVVTGLKWDVDHVLPLAGSKVCGLHVWNNLQVIPAVLNRKKLNKMIEVNWK